MSNAANTPQQTTQSGDGRPVRHILALSGGKDSTALALYMRDKVPEMEYVFCDTGEELQETYEYLERIEAHLGKPVTRLNPERPFRHSLENACPLEELVLQTHCARRDSVVRCRRFEQGAESERNVSIRRPFQYVGLPQTRTREFLLNIAFAKREVFAYACEAYSRILERAKCPADRRRLYAEYVKNGMPRIDEPDRGDLVAALAAAIDARNGWKRILAHCSPPRRPRSAVAPSAAGQR